jgi:hypothetical protein
MKLYIDVIAHFKTDGSVLPIYLYYDGNYYKIDHIKHITPAASLKSGGMGLRYTCNILGQVRYLFLEDTKWFIEK